LCEPQTVIRDPSSSRVLESVRASDAPHTAHDSTFAVLRSVLRIGRRWPGPELRGNFLTVGAINSNARPQDRADVATLYAALFAGPLWNQVARQLSAAEGTGLSANARAFALLNMAIADGLITVMETKYRYTFWRPETAVRQAASDGNRATVPDPTFTPFITTPCHPSYPSAHATLSYAARTIIDRVWGNDGHSIVVEHPALPQISLSYTRLDQITTDIDDARVYGGIHYRFDQVAGARQGNRIGEYTFRQHLHPRGRR
jgi:membrane-associated phospholipid phosphatase